MTGITSSTAPTPQLLSAMFFDRYHRLYELMKDRLGDEHILLARHIPQIDRDENVVFVGLVSAIERSRNGHTIVTIEDPSGTVRVLCHRSRKDLMDNIADVVLDCVVGVVGTTGDRIVFANKLIFPGDVYDGNTNQDGDEGSIGTKLQDCSSHPHAVIISDIEVGSVNFLDEAFEQFLTWLCSDDAPLITHLIIAGDLVAGVGVYPGQEKELVMTDITAQYRAMAVYLKRLPQHISLIICPGNHDAQRLADPQPPLPQHIRTILSDVNPRIQYTGSPASVTLTTDTVSRSILMYHGMSIPHYATTMSNIASQGGIHRPDLVMRRMLRWAHLSPTYGIHPITSMDDRDHMVIDSHHDIFITGHTHTTACDTNNGIVLINPGCWTSQTDHQRNLGITPRPARAAVVDLVTLRAELFDFKGGDTYAQR